MVRLRQDRKSSEFRMAQIASGCFCLCTDDFTDCSCPAYADGRYTDKDTQRPGSTGKQSLKNEDNEEPCGTDDDSEPLCKLVRDKENDSHFNFLTDAKLQKLCKRATSMPMLHK